MASYFYLLRMVLVFRHWWHWWHLFFLRDIAHQCFGSQNHGGDAGSILQCGPGDLQWVDDALAYHIHIITFSRIITNAFLAALNFINDYRAFLTGIDGDPAQRFFNSLLDDIDTGCFVTCRP